MAPNRRMVDPLLKSSLEMRNAFCATPKPHFLAQIVAPFSANRALSTWNTDFQRNPIANREAIYVRPDANYYAGRFMTKRQRCASTKVSVGEFLVVTDI